MDQSVTTPPAAPGPAAPARKRFADPTADLVGQILPHLQRVKDDSEEEADSAAISYARNGAKDGQLLEKAGKLYARVDAYGAIVAKLLADPLLPAEVAQWFQSTIASD